MCHDDHSAMVYTILILSVAIGTLYAAAAAQEYGGEMSRQACGGR